MNIALIGYRGTGKSHVGRLLSQKLNLTYVSLDKAVAERAAMTIPQIVEKFGWPDFRDKETFEVRQVAGQDGLIVDCGGGVIERPENIELLRASSRIVWLQASVPVIVARIGGDDGRPALTAGKTFTEEIAEVLARRTPVYAAAAEFTVDTDSLSPEEIAARIAAFVTG
ncbi:MAG: shikimate kinase [Geobacter sp.]|nr:shikimate kinase [Geobacter sp.]